MYGVATSSYKIIEKAFESFIGEESWWIIIYLEYIYKKKSLDFK